MNFCKAYQALQSVGQYQVSDMVADTFAVNDYEDPEELGWVPWLRDWSLH